MHSCRHKCATLRDSNSRTCWHTKESMPLPPPPPGPLVCLSADAAPQTFPKTSKNTTLYNCHVYVKCNRGFFSMVRRWNTIQLARAFSIFRRACARVVSSVHPPVNGPNPYLPTASICVEFSDPAYGHLWAQPLLPLVTLH